MLKHTFIYHSKHRYTISEIYKKLETRNGSVCACSGVIQPIRNTITTTPIYRDYVLFIYICYIVNNLLINNSNHTHAFLHIVPFC